MNFQIFISWFLCPKQESRISTLLLSFNPRRLILPVEVVKIRSSVRGKVSDLKDFGSFLYLDQEDMEELGSGQFQQGYLERLLTPLYLRHFQTFEK